MCDQNIETMEKITVEQFEDALGVINQFIEQTKKDLSLIDSLTSSGYIMARPKFRPYIYDVFSLRVRHILKLYFADNNIPFDARTPIDELNGVSLKHLMSYRNFGTKSRYEIESVCAEHGVKLAK